MIGTYMYENGKQWSPSSQKLKQTLLEKFGVQKGAKKNHIITHTDLSGGTTLRNGTYGPGNYSVSDANRLEFLQELARGMKYGGNACINELAPTDVRTLFVDMDMTIGKDNKRAEIFFEPSTYEDIVKNAVFPTMDEYFPKTWRQKDIKFAIACPNKLRYKGGGKKFGAHIRCLQTRDHYGNCVGVYLHVDNMAYFRRSLVYKLCELYPEDEYDIDWDKAVDWAPIQNGGMRMIGMRKWKTKCTKCRNADPEEKEFCDCDGGFVYDSTVYEMSSVLSTDGSPDHARLKALKEDMVLMWVQTSISTPYDHQEQANKVMGMAFNADDQPILSQDERLKANEYKVALDDGRPEKRVLKRKAKMTSSDKHRKRQREAMEEVDDRNMRVRLQNFIHKAFPHYKRQVRVESISRMSGKKSSVCFVNLSGKNAGCCLNKKGGGTHADRTYIQICSRRGATQRCYSQNCGEECVSKVPCKKFHSNYKKLPEDIHNFLFAGTTTTSSDARHSAAASKHSMVAQQFNSVFGFGKIDVSKFM